jgi:hypothetical protein
MPRDFEIIPHNFEIMLRKSEIIPRNFEIMLRKSEIMLRKSGISFPINKIKYDTILDRLE